jgi:MFS family permease
MYLLSCWYSRFQLQKRIALFYSVNILMAAFGNLLAFGLKHMDGLGDLEGWRWIFIIEGLITIVLAFIGLFVIVDFPDKVSQTRRPFLTPDEVQTIKDVLDADRGEEGGELGRVSWGSIGRVLITWQPYVQ